MWREKSVGRPVRPIHSVAIHSMGEVVVQLDFAQSLLSCGWMWLATRQNCRHFSDDIFKCNFLNENVWISTESSLKFVPKIPINKIPALVQIMAWCRPGDKALSELMMVRLPTHMCHSASFALFIETLVSERKNLDGVCATNIDESFTNME